MFPNKVPGMGGERGMSEKDILKNELDELRRSVELRKRLYERATSAAPAPRSTMLNRAHTGRNGTANTTASKGVPSKYSKVNPAHTVRSHPVAERERQIPRKDQLRWSSKRSKVSPAVATASPPACVPALSLATAALPPCAAASSHPTVPTTVTPQRPTSLALQSRKAPSSSRKAAVAAQAMAKANSLGTTSSSASSESDKSSTSKLPTLAKKAAIDARYSWTRTSSASSPASASAAASMLAGVPASAAASMPAGVPASGAAACNVPRSAVPAMQLRSSTAQSGAPASASHTAASAARKPVGRAPVPAAKRRQLPPPPQRLRWAKKRTSLAPAAVASDAGRASVAGGSSAATRTNPAIVSSTFVASLAAANPGSGKEGTQPATAAPWQTMAASTLQPAVSKTAPRRTSPRTAKARPPSVARGASLRWRRVSGASPAGKPAKPSAASPAGHRASTKPATAKNPAAAPISAKMSWRRRSWEGAERQKVRSTARTSPRPAAAIPPLAKATPAGGKQPHSGSKTRWQSKTFPGKHLAVKANAKLPSPSQLKWRRVSLSKSDPPKSSLAVKTPQKVKRNAKLPSPSQLKWRRVTPSKPGGSKSGPPAQIPNRRKLKWTRIPAAAVTRAGRGRGPGKRVVASTRKSPRAQLTLPSRQQLKWRRQSLTATLSPLRKKFAKPAAVPPRSQLNWRRLGNAKSPLRRKGPSNRYSWVREGAVESKVTRQSVAPPLNPLQLALYGPNGWNSYAVQRHMRYVSKATLRAPAITKSQQKPVGQLAPARAASKMRSPHLVNIHGEMFRSTSMKLQRVDASAPKPTSKSSDSNAAMVVPIRGVRYQLDSSGRILQKMHPVSKVASNTSPPLRRRSMYYLGGVPFREMADGNYERWNGVDSTQLAREKVRRSIQLSNCRKSRTHIGRFKGYCTFFNRFGHCRRGDRCLYVHDREKVAVCMKFLKGLCDKSEDECKLSHSLSKNKVPVCHFFLQGRCPKDNCPYAHVNVNKDASPCKDFMDGNCPLGEKCAKKHVVVCVNYLRGEVCRDGAKCRFYHPPDMKGNADDGQSPRERRRSPSMGVQEPVAFRKERLRKIGAEARRNGNPSLIISRPEDSDETVTDDEDERPNERKSEATDRLPRSPLRIKPSFLS